MVVSACAISVVGDRVKYIKVVTRNVLYSLSAVSACARLSWGLLNGVAMGCAGHEMHKVGPTGSSGSGGDRNLF